MVDSDKLFHYVYWITHIPSDRFYVGVRSCDCLPEEDNYFGSGSAWKFLLNKYPKENFKKEIICVLSSRIEANSAEEEILGNLYDTNPLCMNLIAGGDSRLFSNDLRNSHIQRWKNSLELREKARRVMGETMKELWEIPEYYEKMCAVFSKIRLKQWQDPKYREKITQGLKEKWKDPELREKQSKMMKGHWKDPEFRRLVSEARKEKWKDPVFVENHRNRMRKQWEEPGRKEIYAVQMMERWRNPEYQTKTSTAISISKLKISKEELYSEIESVFQLDLEGFSTSEIAKILNKGFMWVHRILSGQRHSNLTKDLREQRNQRIKDARKLHDPS